MQVTPKRPLTSTEEKYSERFIPNRNTSNLLTTFDKFSDDKSLNAFEETDAVYNTLLQHQFLNVLNNRKILRFNATPGKENVFSDLSSPEFFTPLSNYRKIAKSPYKVLDAPSLLDDFYLNLLDWSVTNQLIVGLGSCVYVWNAFTSKVTKLCDLGLSDTVTSVSASGDGQYVTIGSQNGTVSLWDTLKFKLIRNLYGHSTRVGTVAWNSDIVSSGSRDRTILNRDIRVQRDIISRLSGHKQEVCGLKWSFDQQQLSSGGNDNKLILWNLHSTQPVYKFSSHSAAVKALAWSPHQYGLLASGGGTADKTIRYWNTLNGEEVGCIDSGSQVCNLVFSKNTQEIVSTHGYSMNQIIVWNKGKKVVTLSGHNTRVLYLALSPDGQNIVTGAGDETLRFWNVFPIAGIGVDRCNSLMLSAWDLR